MKSRHLAVALAAAFAFAACRRDAAEIGEAAPVDQLQRTYWPLADFSLTERNGKLVGLADLKGKVWVADFFYSTCPGPCPMLSSRLSDLQKTFGDDDRIRLVSISADPEKDTPEVLQKYAEKFHANARWLFLTGAKEAVKSLAFENFKLPFAEQPGAAEPIVHSTRLILIDQTGTVRGLYEGVGDTDPAHLIRDIRLLLNSKS